MNRKRKAILSVVFAVIIGIGLTAGSIPPVVDPVTGDMPKLDPLIYADDIEYVVQVGDFYYSSSTPGFALAQDGSFIIVNGSIGDTGRDRGSFSITTDYQWLDQNYTNRVDQYAYIEFDVGNVTTPITYYVNYSIVINSTNPEKYLSTEITFLRERITDGIMRYWKVPGEYYYIERIYSGTYEIALTIGWNPDFNKELNSIFDGKMYARIWYNYNFRDVKSVTIDLHRTYINTTVSSLEVFEGNVLGSYDY